MNKYTFRLAEQTDIPELCRLRLAYFHEEFGTLPANQEAQIAAQLPAYFNARLNADCFVPVAADPTGTLCACAILNVMEKPANPYFPNGRLGEVLGVFTEPEHRHNGCATKLMEMLIDCGKAQRLSLIRLSATEFGLPIYEKLGFAVTHSSYTAMELKLTQEEASC